MPHTKSTQRNKHKGTFMPKVQSSSAPEALISKPERTIDIDPFLTEEEVGAIETDESGLEDDEPEPLESLWEE